PTSAWRGKSGSTSSKPTTSTSRTCAGPRRPTSSSRHDPYRVHPHRGRRARRHRASVARTDRAHSAAPREHADRAAEPPLADALPDRDDPAGGHGGARHAGLAARSGGESDAVGGAPALHRAAARPARRVRLLHHRGRLQSRPGAQGRRLRQGRAAGRRPRTAGLRARDPGPVLARGRAARRHPPPARPGRGVRGGHAPVRRVAVRAQDEPGAGPPAGLLREGGRGLVRRRGAADDADRRPDLRQHRREPMEPAGHPAEPGRRDALPDGGAVRVGDHLLLSRDARLVGDRGDRSGRPRGPADPIPRTRSRRTARDPHRLPLARRACRQRLRARGARGDPDPVQPQPVQPGERAGDLPAAAGSADSGAADPEPAAALMRGLAAGIVAGLLAAVPAAAAARATATLDGGTVLFFSDTLQIVARDGATLAFADGTAGAADAAFVDLKNDRVVLAGHARLAHRGVSVRADAIAVELAGDRVDLLDAASGVTRTTRALGPAVPADIDAQRFAFPDVSDRNAFIRSRHAAITPHADVRFRPAAFPTSVGGLPVPSYLYTFATGAGFGATSLPGSDFDQPYGLWGSPTSLTAVHARWEDGPGPAIGLQESLVSGDDAYATAAFDQPIRGYSTHGFDAYKRLGRRYTVVADLTGTIYGTLEHVGATGAFGAYGARTDFSRTTAGAS